VLPADTTPEAAEVQREVFRRMTFAQRFRRAYELAELGRELARSGIRQRHPSYTADEVEWAMHRMMLRDDDLYRRAWPSRPLLDP
jgi:hypothetical protein